MGASPTVWCCRSYHYTLPWKEELYVIGGKLDDDDADDDDISSWRVRLLEWEEVDKSSSRSNNCGTSIRLVRGQLEAQPQPPHCRPTLNIRADLTTIAALESRRWVLLLGA